MLVQRTAVGPAVAVTSVAQPTRPYVQSAGFDAALLVLPLLTGVAAITATVINPLLYPALLVADLWLLGYHHVVATYTRLASDARTFKQNRFLALDLLFIVVAVAIAITVGFGTWVITTAFLYLQWFHYMRQGYGIARMYYRTTAASRCGQTRDLTTDAVIYLVPIYGILQRSATMGDRFLGSPVKAFVAPDVIITGVGIAAAAAVLVWIVRTAWESLRGELEIHYAGFVASHVAIFMLAYVLVSDVNFGWLGINVWHNFQYVMVVWMVNAKRYSGGIDPQARFMSTISQPKRVISYFLSCLAISTFVYLNLTLLTKLLIGGGLAAALGFYMGINFHHYVVDAMIWKRRRVVAQVQAA